MSSAACHSFAPSPWGNITLLSDGNALTGLVLPDSRWELKALQRGEQQDELPVFTHARAELAAYFAGKLQLFTTPINPQGSAFQQQVWQALQRIPYSHTASYSQIAAMIGQPTAIRAVANANARNPLPLLVPCHRILGKTGKLTGYSGGGVARKAELLKLESVSSFSEV